nr:hypothetical protein [Tanacetum cinerariifolium]
MGRGKENPAGWIARVSTGQIPFEMDGAKAMGKEDGEPFPRQSQDNQPGKEHVMDNIPQFGNPHYNASSKLHGKVALVTEGDSGIGRAVCYCFVFSSLMYTSRIEIMIKQASWGETIAFTYVKGDEDNDAEDTLNIINESKISDSSDPIAIPVDLGYEKNCKNVIDEGVSDEFSHFFLTRYAVKHMKEGSSIINSTSVLAYTGSPKWLDYSSTKGAVVSFTRGLALHLVDKGIRVNAVAPGPHLRTLPTLVAKFSILMVGKLLTLSPSEFIRFVDVKYKKPGRWTKEPMHVTDDVRPLLMLRIPSTEYEDNNLRDNILEFPRIGSVTDCLNIELYDIVSE